jgi:predicted regulator of Ras-like GTPase activity (Roadblock/LC7/MglB family)
MSRADSVRKTKHAAEAGTLAARLLLQTPLTMFKIFKKLFNKGGDNPVAVAPRVPRAVAAAPVATGFRNPEAAPGVEVASLSLRAILERLPADLRAAVNQMPEGDVKVILPVNAIMKQLPTGAVKMSLGSLYRQAPNGTFRKTNFEDKRMIDVPLGEVFKNINPGRLHRRNDQRQYEVPDDVQGLFGSGGDRNVPASGPAAPSPVVTEPVKPLRMPSLAPSPAAQPNGQNGVKSPTNGHGGHGHAPSAMSMPAPEPQQPAEALKLTGELSLLLVEIGAGWPEGIRSELSVLTGDTKVILPVAEVSAGLQKGKVAFTWGQVRNWLSPAPTTPIHLPEETMLTLPLKIVAPAFVAATGAKKRQSGANVNQSLPDFFGPSAGRTPAVAPTPPVPAALAPLPPLTMPAPTPVPVEPELAAKPPVEAVPVPSLSIAAEPPVAPPVAFAPVVAATPAPLAPAPVGAGPADLATLFNLPGKTDWSPNELVKLTCGLSGVIGAVVALEEGLVVAQKLPDGLSPDTFAAFMPQIFSRLDKYTGEMQLGDTTEVTISTAGGPCQFFRRGKLFFATLGRSGECLPAGLHLVAMELANQNN